MNHNAGEQSGHGLI